MNKYKNLFLSVLCFVVGVVAIIGNLGVAIKSFKRTNISKVIIKIDNNYVEQNTHNISYSSEVYIKNQSFALNSNYNNKLNNIVLTSEENIYGLKNLYTIGSISNKIIKSKEEIRIFKQNKKKEITNENTRIKNIKLSIVSNSIISYSNYYQNKRTIIYSPMYMATLQNKLSADKSWQNKKSNITSNNSFNDLPIFLIIKKWIHTHKKVLIYSSLGYFSFIVSGFILAAYWNSNSYLTDRSHYVNRALYYNFVVDNNTPTRDYPARNLRIFRFSTDNTMMNSWINDKKIMIIRSDKDFNYVAMRIENWENNKLNVIAVKSIEEIERQDRGRNYLNHLIDNMAALAFNQIEAAC